MKSSLCRWGLHRMTFFQAVQHTGREKESLFRENPDEHHSRQVTKAASDSHQSCWPCMCWERRHENSASPPSLPPTLRPPSYQEKNTRQIPVARHSTKYLSSPHRNAWGHQNRKCPRNCHSHQEPKETWPLNVMQDPGTEGKKKGIK